MTKQKSIRLETATGNRLLKAYDFAAGRVQKEPEIIRAMTSAGFIIPNGQRRGQRRGYQVFVTLIAFDEAQCLSKPNTGGLKVRL